jgi:hypothetical protein
MQNSNKIQKSEIQKRVDRLSRKSWTDTNLPNVSEEKIRELMKNIKKKKSLTKKMKEIFNVSITNLAFWIGWLFVFLILFLILKPFVVNLFNFSNKVSNCVNNFPQLCVSECGGCNFNTCWKMCDCKKCGECLLLNYRFDFFRPE